MYALRLQGVFAPELTEPGGQAVAVWVREWISRHSDGEWPLVVETFRTRTGRDLTTLERYVAVVSPAGSDRVSLNEEIRARITAPT